MKVECPICGKIGSLQIRGNSYRIAHYVGYKNNTSIIQWHYLVNGKESLVKNNPNLFPFYKNNTMRLSSSWLGHKPSKNINLIKYKEYLLGKYRSKVYANEVFRYSIKYYDFYNNLALILTVPESIRNNILKSLIALSKFLGEYLEFHMKIKQHGIKWVNQNSFTSFIKIFNNNHSSLIEWYKEALKILKSNEQIWLKYLALSGLRREESIMSFNKIIELSTNNKISEYVNEKNIIEHFKHKEFLRGTKNAYITIVPEKLIENIKVSGPVYFSTIRKRFIDLPMRFREIRNFFSNIMAKNGLLSEEVDLLQGRIPKSIFCRYYLKENFIEFKSRVLKVNKKLEKMLIE